MFASCALNGSMLPRFSRFLAGLALTILIGSAAHEAAAQVRAPRAALVIGNGAYSQAPIENAVEGARSVANVLVQGGFKVLYLENAWRGDIQQALATFGQILEGGAQGIVFYSGHAIQYEGRNYLVALNSNIGGPDDVRREAIEIGSFVEPLLAARTSASAVILDASYANPWQTVLPGGLHGLTAPEPMKSVSVVFSTAPGKVVSGVPQAAGAFSTQLVQAMKTPGLGFNEVISRTRSAVAFSNGKEQTVWQSQAAIGDLVVIPSTTVGAKPADSAEQVIWDRIKNSSTVADYQSYLGAYPNGQFAQAARAKLAQLQPAPPPQTPPARDPGSQQTQTAAVRPGTPSPPATAAPAPPTLAAPAPPQAATGLPLRDCANCPELVLIPAGTMTMGSKDGFPFEAPVHEVTIAKPFYMGRREVTFDEWDACQAEGGCQHRPGDRGQGRGLRPVSDIDWNDAKAYVAWLSKKTGKVYRLPTEAEWEYAARAGTKTAYYWGNAVDNNQANCTKCSPAPHNNTVATGTFPPNAFGLVDMAGNAAEWVEDCWSDNYSTAPKDGSAFNKPDCRERVLRGGAFNNDQRFVRTAARFKYDFDVRYYANGFRIVRER
jgi:formylglycine-generating enzyme required for sulfatase activity